MDVIVSHVNADFDSLGALVGAGRLYPGAALVLPGGEADGVREFRSLHATAIETHVVSDIDPETITRVVVVDTNSRKRLGKAAAWLDLPGVEIHLYDHHTESPGDLTPSRQRVEAWGSASTILTHLLIELGETPTPIEATALLLGIYADTGSLSFAGTVPEDLEAAAWLLRAGGDLEAVAEFTRQSLNPEQRRLLRELLAAVEVHEVRGARIAVSAIQPGPHVDGAAPLVTRLLEMEEADAAFALAEMEGTLYVIGRGRCASVDVGGLIRELGGGGHPRAASARLKDASAREVKARLIELLERHVTPEPTAREIMAYPVRTILPDVSVAEARRRMIRYGHSGLAVAEGGRLVGVVTRRDADKARHHRLEHAPVRGFMTAHVHTVGPDTPLSEIERVMIAEGVGRLPVLRDGALIGIVTRSDVLKAQYGARYLAGKPTGIEEPVAQLLKERLPATVQRLLDEVGLAAAREDCQAYVVGGFVRDLILGERNLDVDILVEPDGAALARGFAAACGGVFKNIERFGTAKVTLLDGFDVDFATARTEAYAQPGALPEVEPSSITDDLRRRDFAFNALALALRPERFGELLDPFGGREDLQLRRVRVLHNLSFIEDPTRIFRAARFEERFHFKMTPQTEMLAREAVETDALGTIKPERRRQELYRTFREPRLFAALLRLQDLGVLRWMHEELVLDEALWHAVPRALEWWKGHGGSAVDRKLVFLGALLTPLGAESAAETAGRQLRVPPPDLKRMASALWAMEAADELLPPDADAAAVTRLLQPLAPETLVLLRACATSRSQEGDTALSLLDRFVAEWRNVRLEITGEDLMALGYSAGPRIGEALRRTLDARLRGEISGRDEELAYARRLLDANGGGAAPPTG